MGLYILEIILLSTFLASSSSADANDDRIVFFDNESPPIMGRSYAPDPPRPEVVDRYISTSEPGEEIVPQAYGVVEGPIFGPQPPAECPCLAYVRGEQQPDLSPPSQQVGYAAVPVSVNLPPPQEMEPPYGDQPPQYPLPLPYEKPYPRPPFEEKPLQTPEPYGEPAIAPQGYEKPLLAPQTYDKPPLLAEPDAKPMSYEKQRPEKEVRLEEGNGYADQISNEEGEGCTCVPYYLCANGSILTDGTGLLDIRVKPAVCENYMDVCCNNPLNEKEAIKPAPTKRQGCGFRHPQGIGFRITGAEDNEAQFGEFPWMTAILKTSNDDSGILMYQCGGALISDNVVLTAAHCVKTHKPRDLIVRAGEWDTQTTNEVFPHKDVRVAEIVAHPQFSSGSLWNDIAIMILEEPFPLGENIDTVCLPNGGEPPQHQECFASGWGKNQFGDEGRSQVILKKVDLPIVPDQKCESLLRETRLGRFYKLHPSFVCAGGVPGKDTCKGDGGSPLVCPIYDRPGMYEVTGIVSWGIGCGGETPGIYADVAYARNWIDQTLARFNIQLE